MTVDIDFKVETEEVADLNHPIYATIHLVNSGKTPLTVNGRLRGTVDVLLLDHQYSGTVQPSGRFGEYSERSVPSPLEPETDIFVLGIGEELTRRRLLTEYCGYDKLDLPGKHSLFLHYIVSPDHMNTGAESGLKLYGGWAVSNEIILEISGRIPPEGVASLVTSNLDTILRQQGREKGDEKGLPQVQTAENRQALSVLNLIKGPMFTEDYSTALEILRKSPCVRDFYLTYLLMTECLMFQEKYEEAAEVAERAIKQHEGRTLGSHSQPRTFVDQLGFNTDLVRLYTDLQQIYSLFRRQEHSEGIERKVVCHALEAYRRANASLASRTDIPEGVFGYNLELWRYLAPLYVDWNGGKKISGLTNRQIMDDVSQYQMQDFGKEYYLMGIAQALALERRGKAKEAREIWQKLMENNPHKFRTLLFPHQQRLVQEHYAGIEK